VPSRGADNERLGLFRYPSEGLDARNPKDQAKQSLEGGLEPHHRLADREAAMLLALS
jgi:hypothetical protein